MVACLSFCPWEMADLVSNRFNGCPWRFALPLALEDHAHCALHELRGILVAFFFMEPFARVLEPPRYPWRFRGVASENALI